MPSRPSDPDPVSAHAFATSLGTMAVCWRTERALSTHLPEPNPELLLESVRQSWDDPGLSWSPASRLPAPVASLITLMQRHLAGERVTYPLALLSLEHTSPFFRLVYECTLAIPAGETRSYQEIAAAAGSVLASRAVGQAMARNRLPLVIPCHRVLAAGKKPGGYSAAGGLATKERLLRIEAHATH